MEEEQVYTIPLRDARKAERKRRAGKAVKLVREFLKKHLNVNSVIIDSSLNRKIWRKGVEKPPAKVRVRAVKRSDKIAEAYSLEG